MRENYSDTVASGFELIAHVCFFIVGVMLLPFFILGWIYNWMTRPSSGDYTSV